MCDNYCKVARKTSKMFSQFEQRRFSSFFPFQSFREALPRLGQILNLHEAAHGDVPPNNRTRVDTRGFSSTHWCTMTIHLLSSHDFSDLPNGFSLWYQVHHSTLPLTGESPTIYHGAFGDGSTQHFARGVIVLQRRAERGNSWDFSSREINTGNDFHICFLTR